MGKADSVVSLNNLMINISSAPIEVSAGDYFETMAAKEASGTFTPNNDEETWFAIEKLDPSLKRVLVYNSTTTSLTAGAFPTLSWDSEVYDTDGFHSTVTNPSRLTAPANGYYRVGVNLQGGSVTGQMQVIMQKNGAGATGCFAKDIDTNAEENINAWSAPMFFTAGDYATVVVEADTATSIQTGNSIWFAMESVPTAYKKCLATKASTQAISANTTTAVTFDSEAYDDATMHSTVTNISRISVPSGCT
jgi:hypothetical protein